MIRMEGAGEESMTDAFGEKLSAAYRWTMRKQSYPLLELSDEKLDELAVPLMRSLHLWSRRLTSMVRSAAQMKRQFEEGMGTTLSYEGRAKLKSTWASIHDYMVALDRIKMLYTPFPGICPTKRRRVHLRSFVFAYYSFVVQYTNALKIIRIVDALPTVVALMNESSSEFGLEAGTYDHMKWNTLHMVDVSKMAAGDHYAKRVAREICQEAEGEVLYIEMRKMSKQAFALLRRNGLSVFVRNGRDLFKTKAFNAWFPIQKGVAHWLGGKKIKPGHTPLISSAVLERVRGKLEPGDIMLERRNWNVTNAGLPGFWPHAAIYLGTPAELCSYFDGEETVERINRGYGHAWKKYHEIHEDGNPHAVIEALAPGVLFNSFEHSATADYLGVLRPRLSLREKGIALERAFSYWGRPYDFNFNFETDSSLVCSELVFKSYQKGKYMKGIPFTFTKIAGRRLLPPNQIVAQFDKWYETEDYPLEFVTFIDGVEKTHDSIEQDVCAFRQSHCRAKWSIMQQ